MNDCSMVKLCLKRFGNYFKVFHESVFIFLLRCYSWKLIIFVYIKKVKCDSECGCDIVNAMHLNEKTTTTKCQT